MKTLKRGLLMAFVLGVLIVNVSWASGSGAYVATYTDYSTTTIKFTLDGDSAKSIGVDHRSDSALKTPFRPVPVGIPFWVYTETRDHDSAKCFGPDTIHVGLETAPSHSIAVVSAGTQKADVKAQLMWDFSSINYTAFCQQTYFDLIRYDTLPNDTLAITAVSLKGGPAAKVTTPMCNMGYLRFSACLDDADSLLDSGLRLNLYIVYRDPASTGYGNVDDLSEKYGQAFMLNEQTGEVAIYADRRQPGLSIRGAR